MNHYSLFSFNVASQIPLSLPPSSFATADVTVNLSETTRPVSPHDWDIAGPPTNITFFWAEAGWFTIENGRQITVWPIDNPGHGVIEDTILGECMGTALIQRDELVLHASAIQTPAGAVIFSGASGLGKSTSAYLGLQNGGAILADDLCLVRLLDGVPHVIPGPPWLKVKEPAIRSVGKTPEEYPIAFAESEKYRVSTPPVSNPVPIKSLVLLDEGDELALDPCPTVNAFWGVMENSFATHLSDSYEYAFLDNPMRKTLFKACEQLVQSVNVSVLTRTQQAPSPKDLHDLGVC